VPEGDTIHRSARTLHQALAGKEVLRFQSRHPRLAPLDLAGSQVQSVEARGKNLLIDFGVATLHTHMRMRGAWHIYRDGDRWKRPRRAAEIIIVTEPWSAVGFSIPEARWIRGAERDEPLPGLGPDLLDDAIDTSRFALALQHADPLGVSLMDQSRLSGIGNVYKSELCFLAGADPFAAGSTFDDELLTGLVENARRLLRRNLHTPVRTTRPDRAHPLWVYRRRGERCFRCSTPIEMRHQGDALLGQALRSTYFCPRCQNVDA
jgi:endonuclease-8